MQRVTEKISLWLWLSLILLFTTLHTFSVRFMSVQFADESIHSNILTGSAGTLGCIGPRILWRTAALTKHRGAATADDTSPNPHRLWELWFSSSPIFLQNLGPWFQTDMQDLLLSQNRTLEDRTNQFFWISSVRYFGRTFLWLTLLSVLPMIMFRFKNP